MIARATTLCYLLVVSTTVVCTITYGRFYDLLSKEKGWEMPLAKLLNTSDSVILLLLRAVLALVILAHGLQKLFGWFGGFGFVGTMGYFTGTLGIPWIFGFAAILAETVGALLLFTGLLSRLAALSIAVVMVVATLTVHLPNGFFMNWFGTQAGEGFEFFLLATAMAMAVVIGGGGAWSVDRRLARHFRGGETPSSFESSRTANS